MQKKFGKRDMFNFAFSEKEYNENNSPSLLQPYEKLETASILVKNISYIDKKTNQVILNDIFLPFFDNENIGIIGRNGSGKTTLVEMIAGLIKPDRGTINYNYHFEYSFSEKIGIQFQNNNFPPNIRLKDLLDFVITANDNDITKEELDNMLCLFSLSNFYKKNINKLSGGEMQRASLLLSILHLPKFLFLDEFTSNLDLYNKNKLISFVKEFCKINNINIILVSHDLEEVEEVCNRLIIMERGKIKSDLSLKEIKEKYSSLSNFCKLFL
ncbi:MAG: ATP-binding cassette domain-containing protein [Metamycoplasmataceae bacterium]